MPECSALSYTCNSPHLCSLILRVKSINQPGSFPWAKLYPQGSNPLSIAALIAANLIPIALVLAGQISVAEIMILYWMENVIIGCYQVLKMLTAIFTSTQPGGCGCVTIPFFIVHYGMFTFVHGIFVFAIFGSGLLSSPAARGRITEPFDVLGNLLSNAGVLWIPLVALVASHGVSFYVNFIRGGEFRRFGLDVLMQQPYKRVVILHMTILLGAFMALALKSAVIPLLVLTLLKIAVDLSAHLKEHRFPKAEVTPPTQSSP